MDFQDFCRYFTDVVVCRLAERTLLWLSSHWREVKRYGEWVLAPTPHVAPLSAALHSNTANNARPERTEQRWNRREARLRETSREEEDRKSCEKRRSTDLEMNGSQEVLMDRRSRCGGCINHRDTFLQNPQVRMKKKPAQLSTKC